MSQEKLAGFVEAAATGFAVPGAVVGVLVDGRELYAAHGVTGVEYPRPVHERTLFPLGPVVTTITATALVRLAARGRVDLDAPVRRYVPEFALPDERAASAITVRTLLDHTAGLDHDVVDGGPAAESLAEAVTRMAGLPVVAAPGERASYSRAGYKLAGRVIEKVTGLPYEQAVARLVLEPVGLTDTFFDLDDMIVRECSTGYHRDEDGRLRAVTPWKALRGGARGEDPAGGGVSSASDLLRWARFHLGGGDGVLPAEALHGMRRRTAGLHGGASGDASADPGEASGDGFGLGWLLRRVGGTATIGHGGAADGQSAELVIVPERNTAVVSLANLGPDGRAFNQAVVRWALEEFAPRTPRAARDGGPLAYGGPLNWVTACR
ncbi:serine hydrolase domain-containing protein [Kitasatospora sp. NPDC004240]